MRERVRDRAEEFRAFGGFKKAVVVVPVLILWGCGCLPFDGALLQDISFLLSTFLGSGALPPLAGRGGDLQSPCIQ